jgi:AcrR family transcriptional regulator
VSRDGRKDTQRERLVAGMVQAAVRDGYAGATVGRVIAHAGVSRPTFYDYFKDRDDCFLAVHREIAERLLERIREAVAVAPPERAIEAGARALLQLAETEPDATRLLTNETMAAGPRALDQRDRTIERIEQILEPARGRAPLDAATPDVPTSVVLGAIHWLLAPPLRRGERDLTELAADLIGWIESYRRPTSEHRWRSLEPGPPIAPSPHASELSLQPPPPLPPGRPRLSTAEIARNHRERILFATAEVAARKGYTAATVTDITTAAGVDRRVFYRHFRDKQQAFLAVHELAVRETMALAASAFFSATTWPERIWEGLRAISQFPATYPILAHIGFVESHAVGTPAVQRIDDSRAAFTLFLQQGLQHAAQPPSSTAQEAITAAVFEVGYRHARAGNIQEMPRLACQATYYALAPFLGPQAADRFIDDKLAEVGV